MDAMHVTSQRHFMAIVLSSQKICALGRAFRATEAGSVGIIFGLALVPIVLMVGAGIDYGRANSVKTDMQAVLDTTALMLAKNPAVPTMSQSQLQTAATGEFTAT